MSPPINVTKVTGSAGDSIRVGDVVRIRNAMHFDGSPVVHWHRGDTARVFGSGVSNGWVEQVSGPEERLGPLTASLSWTHEKPGEYEIRLESGEVLTNYTVEPKRDGQRQAGDPSDYINVSDDDEIEPENYAGIVNADNEEGVALAPSLRRSGVDLGPDGATVTTPDGETVDVGAIEESDEVARYLDGNQAGDVVESDQDVVSDPTSSSGGGAGSGPGGMIGAVGVGVALLVAGAAALIGFGGDD